MKDKLYICNMAGTEHCKKVIHTNICGHQNKHELNLHCVENDCCKTKVKCIPYQEENK
ncbi:MAG TPA: hypothetical protein VJ438_03170 [Candidatus Nanoarchaeia archaeon]|nr:hypothetical protein [Candidatus Nanoarchaeia archaeon]